MTKATDSRVLVLLPVYNGADWLRDQLDSILAQRDVHSIVLCRDDGSTDVSPAILDQFAQRYPGRILMVRDEEGSLGASGSFSHLMQIALRDHMDKTPDLPVALADQDDVWHPDRLSVTLMALQDAGHGQRELPVLVHTDLRVVDADLREVAPSMVRYQGLQPWRTGLVAQMLSNPVTGCTVLCNRALLQRALPVPPEAVMHDWWLTLMATLYGRRVYMDRPLVDYRQHGNNAVGAKAWAPPQRWGNLLRRAFDRGNQAAFEQIAAQAAVLLSRHGGDLTASERLAARLILWQPRLPAPLQKILFRILRRL